MSLQTHGSTGGRRGMKLRTAAALLLGAALLAGPTPALAKGSIEIELMVSRISQEPGKVDPRAKRLDRQLRKEYRYESLSVVKSKTLRLEIDEVGGLSLPNGRKVRVRPLLVDDRGALLAVEVQGSVQTDLRLKSGHLVVIGAQREADGKGDGKLVISLTPSF